jgi:hypothetical protein
MNALRTDLERRLSKFSVPLVGVRGGGGGGAHIGAISLVVISYGLVISLASRSWEGAGLLLAQMFYTFLRAATGGE